MIPTNIKKIFISIILIICSLFILKTVFIIKNATYNTNQDILNTNNKELSDNTDHNINSNHKYLSLATIKFLAHKDCNIELSKINLNHLPHEIQIITKEIIFYNKLKAQTNYTTDIKILNYIIASKIFNISKKSDAKKYYDNILSNKIGILIEYLERTL